MKITTKRFLTLLMILLLISTVFAATPANAAMLDSLDEDGFHLGATIAVTSSIWAILDPYTMTVPATGGMSVEVRQEGPRSTVLLPRATIQQLIRASGDAVAFDVSSLGSDRIRMTRYALNQFAEAQVSVGAVLEAGALTISPAAASWLVERVATDGDVTFRMEEVTLARLTGLQAEHVRGNSVFRITVYSGLTPISGLQGAITASVPFTEPGNPGVWRMGELGELEPIEAFLDPINSRVVFNFDRLSVFLVAPELGGMPQPSQSHQEARAAEIARDAALEEAARFAAEGTVQETSPTQEFPPVQESLPFVQEVPPLLRFSIGDNVFESQAGSAFLEAPVFIDPVYERTMVPFRIIGESLGAEVGWVEATRAVSFALHGQTTELVIGEPLPDGLGIPVIVQDRTFVPLRYVTEVLGAYIWWDPVSASVYVYDTFPVHRYAGQ